MERLIGDQKKCGDEVARVFFCLSPFIPTALEGTKMLSTRQRLSALGFLVFLGATEGCSLNVDVSGPGALIALSGNGQTAAVNTALSAPLEALVVNQFGATIKGATVNWFIESGGGSLSSATVLSNDSGIASVNYTTGPTPGEAVIRAQVHGVPALRFRVTIS